MRVLVFTNMFPTEAYPFYGSFVRDEAHALRAAGMDVDVYFVNGRANKLNYLGMPAGFASRMRHGRYDVVHVHHSYCVLIATLQKRVPVVWTFHEGEIASSPEMIRRDKVVKRVAYSTDFKQRMARRVDRLIVVAEFLRGPLGRPDATVIPSGIDTDRFAPMDTAEAKRTLGLREDRRYVLFPSSPDRIEKRFALARHGVERYREMAATASDVELVCLDRVPHEQVPLYMNASEVLLMTSAFEASPVTVREALCCNVPVICTDIGDASAVLAEVRGSHVVPADATPEDVASALQAVLSGPRRTDSRGAAAKYSLVDTARRIVALYEELAGVTRT